MRRCKCGCGRRLWSNNATGYFTGDRQHKVFVMRLYRAGLILPHVEPKHWPRPVREKFDRLAAQAVRQGKTGLPKETEARAVRAARHLGLPVAAFIAQAVDAALAGRN